MWIEVTRFLQDWALPIAMASGALLVLGLIMTPYLVTRIPADYFAHRKRHSLRDKLRHPAIEFVLISTKNVLGSLLLVVGIIMLFGPGPGIITILLSLSIMNFPGKYRLERWIICRPHVLKSINALRRKQGHPPLIVAH